MFRRIESIESAAVWSGYDGQKSTAPDFQRYNLIYGWNASGKTTLSRAIGLFSGLGKTRLPNSAHVRVSVGNEILDSAREQDRSQIPVRVFNRDFMDDNLQRDDYTHAPALFIVGQENIRLSSRIASLTRRHELLAEMYRTLDKKQIDAKASREKAATELARDCGTMLGIRDFRAPNLKGLAQDLASPAEYLLLDENKLQDAVAQARDQSEFEPFRTFPMVAPPKTLGFDDVVKLLMEAPQQNAIKRLTEATELSEWVRTGLRFHEHTTNCAFCGSDAREALDEYAKHFSDEYRRQHAAIQTAIGHLEQPRILANFPHEKDWVPSVRDKVREALHRLEAWETREKEVRSYWARMLREKLENMDASLSLKPVEDQTSELEAIVAEFKYAKDEHDRACTELAATRRNAADKVKAHFAARYLLDSEEAQVRESLSQVGAILNRVQRNTLKIKAKMEAANAELQRSSVAASQINNLLKRLLGPRIFVEEAQDKRIQFIRDEQPATNMSDGERTAISLAYFLTSLGQNGQQLEDLIVFIDDPISSLDANHIYDVAHLLITSLKPCRQLFVSTHSSEFFNTIKQDWAERSGKFKKEHAAFLIHRESDGISELLELPAHLAKFRSDYHHVFYCLRKLQMSTSQDVDVYISCPNLLRRFLEMYLGFRRPTSKKYVAKLDILFDDEVERGAVARYVDEGSHSASTLRLLEFSDFPAMSRGMVDRVMKALERVDPDHLEVLIAETS